MSATSDRFPFASGNYERVPRPLARRHPLRLSLLDGDMGDGLLSGVWWPQSRDLDVELADLVEDFPRAGFVRHVLISARDWATTPTWVPARGGRLRVASFSHHDPHVVSLLMADLRITCLLVVPPDHDRGADPLRIDIQGQVTPAAHGLLYPA